MTRTLPVVRAGGWYHVVNRGVDRAVLFPTSPAKDEFLANLGEVAHRFAVEIHAYCAMENHFHLLARGPEAELLRAVAQLESGWSADSEGARLRRMAVGRHLLQVTRYIHRNPVEAGLAGQPYAWPWSSYRGYIDPLAGPPWLRSSSVLGWLGSIGSRLRYRQYVEGIDINMSNMHELTYENDGSSR